MRAPDPSKPAGLTRRRLLATGFGVAGVTGVGGASVTAYAATEAFQLEVTRYQITPPRWNAGTLTIAVVSDVHAGGPNMALDRIEQIVAATNALQPDLTVLLGDYGAHHRFITETISYDACIGALAGLKARHGVYAVYGNHDWWYGIEPVRAAFAKTSIPVLENQVVALDHNGKRVWLAGLGDQLAYILGRGRFRGVDDLPGTLAQVTDDAPVILLAHEPDIFPEVPERVSLTLSGHTHGGQVRVPLIWKAFVPSKFGGRYAYGHIVENNRNLIVSGGLGTSIAPVRIGVPPEILHITLG